MLTKPIKLFLPQPESTLPLLLDSPHSGQEYPNDFQSEASAAELLSAWDAYVEQLWLGAVGFGAQLLAAQFPRVVIDPNRDSLDIDPEMMLEPWPSQWGVLAPTPYSVRGMGLIRQLILPNRPMYHSPLPVTEVKNRIDNLYMPYHTALEDGISSLKKRFGRVWHINCHSMKSRPNAMNVDEGRPRPDFVISDAGGTTSSPEFGDFVETRLREFGYSTSRNVPYLGGHIVRKFGCPSQGVNSIQIEINRRLYLDESRVSPSEDYPLLRKNLTRLAQNLCQQIQSTLDPNFPDSEGVP